MKDISQSIDKSKLKISKINRDMLNDNYKKILELKNYNSKLHFPNKDVNSFNEKKLNELKQYMEEEKAFVYGAFYNNELIGFIWGYPHIYFDSRRMFVNSLVVEKKYEKNGIGRQLINELINCAKELKMDEIDLTVAPFNENAMKFYEHLGFVSERIQMKLSI